MCRVHICFIVEKETNENNNHKLLEIATTVNDHVDDYEHLGNETKYKYKKAALCFGPTQPSLNYLLNHTMTYLLSQQAEIRHLTT